MIDMIKIDSRTSELAAKHGANWKTISGSKVLIGKGGKIYAGMGGKYASLADTKRVSGGGFAFSEQGPMNYWMGKDRTKEIEQLVNASGMGELWRRHANDVKVVGDSKGVAYYDPQYHSINFNREKVSSESRGKYATIIHEMSHAIDHNVGYGSTGARGSFAHKYKNGAFLDAINNDVNARVAAKQKAIKAEFEEFKKSGLDAKGIVVKMLQKDYVTFKDAEKVEANLLKGKYPTVTPKMAQRAIGKEFRGMRDIDAVSDIYGSVTGNLARGSYGHSTAYFKRWENRSAEAFAGMCETTACNKKGLAQIKEYLPEAYSVFTEMIGEMKSL